MSAPNPKKWTILSITAVVIALITIALANYFGLDGTTIVNGDTQEIDK